MDGGLMVPERFDHHIEPFKGVLATFLIFKVWSNFEVDFRKGTSADPRFLLHLGKSNIQAGP